MPALPFNLSIIDAIIVAVFAFQILWGLKLGFVLATFSLAGEILGMVAGVLYAPSLAKFLDDRFGLVDQINSTLVQKTQVPANLIDQLGQTLFEAGMFLVIFIGVQAGFFALGRFIHSQVGVRRMTYLSHSFFGMIIGLLKATLEVVFFLIAWNIITADPNLQAALGALGGATNITQNSLLLPFFQMLLPDVSPFAKFF
jgi:uncharacterized membrane protein required for colicin V production